MSKLTEYIQLVKDGLPHIGALAEGILNQVKLEYGNLPKDQQDEIARRRLICEQCPLMSLNAIKAGTYTTARTDPHCTMCGCPITTRTASLSSDCGIANYNIKNPNNPMPLKWEAYKQNEN